MTTKINTSLLKVALSAIDGLRKESFTAAPPPQPDPSMAGEMPPGAAPMDPSMDPSMAGAPPVDPMAAAAGAPMPQLDPAMLAQLLGAGGGAPPGMVPAGDGLPQNGINASAPSTPSQDLKTQIKEVLAETGVIKAPKIKPEQQFQYIADCLQAIASQLSLQLPPPPTADTGENKDSNSGGSKPSSSQSKSASIEDNPIIKAFRKAHRQ